MQKLSSTFALASDMLRDAVTEGLKSSLEGRILNLTRQWGDRNPQSREAAREEARSLMPRDAQFLSNTTARGSGNPVEIYRSESLAPLFPPGNFVGGAPGDFVIIYQINAAGRVTSAILGIGNNP